MSRGSKIIISIAGGVAAGVVINYLLHSGKGSEVSQQLKKAAGDLLDKGKEMLSKAKEDAETQLKEATI